MKAPEAGYAKTDEGLYIAYQVVGEGPVDIAWQAPLFIGSVDVAWESPYFGALFRGLASFSRLILHDRRGTGASSRSVPPPNVETRVADLRLVLDTIGSTRPVLAGGNESGAANVLFAAADPDRIRSLVWWDPHPRLAWASDYPWGLTGDQVEQELARLEHWGTLQFGRLGAEALLAEQGWTVSEMEILHMAKEGRQTCTPDVAKELFRIWAETDVRALLPAVQVPALLITEEEEREYLAMAEYAASLMPDAELCVLAGGGWRGPDELGPFLEAIRRFVGAEPAHVEFDTVLATVLFTDIVESTRIQAELGDHAWMELLLRHHDVVRQALGKWHGVENDTAGDGFYATFDGPARAIRCALEIVERIRDLGIEVRAGVHAGECQILDGKHAGLAVSIGARVANAARPSEVFVSQTVKDLVAGSGYTFEDAGEHELKGVPDRWRLYRVVG